MREPSYRSGAALKAMASPASRRAYGFIAARDSKTGRIEVNDDEAAVVRAIFELYTNGAAPRSIAARLNEEGVPSLVARWRRTKRRRDWKWLASAYMAM